MTTTVKADSRSRVALRGAEKGKSYTVSEQAGGWFVRASARVRRKGLPGAEFQKAWEARPALDEETAREIGENIQRTREADHARSA